MSRPRLGEPIELPWWVPVCAIPPVAVLAGALLAGGPAAARWCGALASLLMIWVLVRVSLRVQSRNMQSVWISAAYAVWFFASLIWLVAALHS